MENTLTELNTYRGYPHYLTRATDIITMQSNRPVNVGDGFTFNQHRQGVDLSEMPVYRVVEVLEERPAKGDHSLSKTPVIYYALKVELSIENNKNVPLLVSN